MSTTEKSATEAAKTYRRATAADLSRGSTVYEQVTYGRGLVKHHEYRVISTNRGAALCETKDGKKDRRLIQFGDLVVEREPERPAPSPVPSSASPSAPPRAPSPPPPPPPPSAPTNARSDDQLEAWLEMGRGLVGDVDREVAELEQTKARIEGELDAIDKHHRGVIQALEQELVDAKRAHEEDRALASTRRDDITKRLARAQERKVLLERLQGV